jgi:protein gp37
MPLDLTDIDWIIVGGESGPNFRPMKMEWAREIRDLAVNLQKPFFYKQDSARYTGMRKYLVEKDGSCWEWLQFPKYCIDPVLVDPEELSTHLRMYPQYGQYLT